MAAAGLSLAADTAAPLTAGVYRYTVVAGEVVSDLPWEQVNENGFGSAENAAIAALAEYDGRLYAGTWNQARSAQVWRTPDGQSWDQVVPSWSVSNTNVSDMETFGSYLYVGTLNEQGGELWRTNGVTWTAVAQGGLGDAKNTGIETLAVFSNTLYLSTANAENGPEIWRSASGDAGSWVPVASDLGGVMDVYAGHLYVGTSQAGSAALWRSGDGLTWTPVFTDGLGEANTHVAAMAEFDGAFYIGTRNVSTGGQVWRSVDGLQWAPVFKYGLGNPDNQRVYGLVSSPQHLYAVISNLSTGAEVWRTADGDIWERANRNGWGDGANGYADYFDKAGVVFRFGLYVGTINDAGGEVWRLPLGRYLYLPLVLR